MATDAKTSADKPAANEPPKKMSNADIWHKMLEDQKFITEARKQGISFQKLREKYGYRFATI